MPDFNERTAGREARAFPARPGAGGFGRAALLLLLFFVLALPPGLPQVEATSRQGSSSPAYLRQLELYSSEAAASLRLAEARREQARRLEEAVLVHRIKRGETLSQIALHYGVPVEALAYWNGIKNPDHIRAGETLYLLTVAGTLHHIREGDTLAAVAQLYNVDRQLVAGYNLLAEDALLTAGQRLVIPGVEAVPALQSGTVTGEVVKEVSLLSLASRGTGTGAGSPPAFHWPLKGSITSFFGLREGQFHYGLDLAAPYGSEVRAMASGTVEFAGVQRGYGLMLVLHHGQGWRSLYAHNSRLLVTQGERVLAGQPITLVGSSGNATGPHLHLEIMQDDRKLDPLLFLP